MAVPRKIFFLFFLLFFLISCDYLNESQEEKLPSTFALLQADRDFSKMSEQIGIKKAFIEYMNEDGILLRPENPPLIGPEAIDYLSLVNEDDYTLSWEPQGAKVSQSGDMGFTYGIYTLKIADTSLQGTYINVWQKDDDGSWKYILNNTNESITAKP